MNVQPVERYRPPTYAKYDYFLKHPEILDRLPERWKRNLLVIVATFFFALIVDGCKKESQQTVKDVTPKNVQYGGPPQMPEPLTELQAITWIQLITEDFGLRFESDSFTIDSFRFPIHINRYGLQSDTIRYSQPRKLVFDGYNAKKRVAVEYISDEDYKTWIGSDSITLNRQKLQYWISADELQAKLRKEHPELHPGIFMMDYGPILEQQVAGFVKWLHKQGVL